MLKSSEATSYALAPLLNLDTDCSKLAEVNLNRKEKCVHSIFWIGRKYGRVIKTGRC